MAKHPCHDLCKSRKLICPLLWCGKLALYHYLPSSLLIHWVGVLLVKRLSCCELDMRQPNISFSSDLVSSLHSDYLFFPNIFSLVQIFPGIWTFYSSLYQIMLSIFMALFAKRLMFDKNVELLFSQTGFQLHRLMECRLKKKASSYSHSPFGVRK